MKYCIPALFFLFLLACKNESKTNHAQALSPGDLPASVKNLMSNVSKNPDSTGLRFQLVDALDSMGDYTEALAQADSMIKRDSLSYALWYRKAMVQENAKDTPGALRSFRYAIRIYPSPDAMLAAANLLAEKGNDTALLLTKEVASFREGREYTAHCNFINGVYYARKGEHAKAMAAFNNCILNDLNYMEAYMEKGFLYYESKKLPEAIQVFTTVITLKNTYPDGYYWLGKCYETNQNKPGAISNYQKALTLDPQLKEAGIALKRLGVN